MKIEKKETVFSGFYQLNHLTLKNRTTNKSFEREQFEVPNSIGVLVKNSIKNTIVLVKQFRIGPEKELIEIVAGKIEDRNEPIEKVAMREVLEETGYRVEKMELIHKFFTCPGPITEEMCLFYAIVEEQIESGGGLASENEEIEVIEMSIEDFLRVDFIDAKTIIAQQWLQLKQVL